MIGSLRLYLAIAGIAALAGGGWWVRDLMADKAALTATVAALEREAAIATQKAEQAALARDVERATVRRLQADAKEYQKIRDWIRSDDPQEPIPASLLAVLDRLLNRDPR